MSTSRFIGSAGGVLLGAAAILAASSASAQTQGSAAPPGSYLKSCREIVFKDGVLSARCEMRGGYGIFAPSSIEPAYCSKRGDIANFNGILECPAAHGWGKGRAYPLGSYKQSCNHPQTLPGPKLVASCNNGHGAWVIAELDLNQCAEGREIGVLNGQLICTPYDGPPRPPRIQRK